MRRIGLSFVAALAMPVILLGITYLGSLSEQAKARPRPPSTVVFDYYK
jgi:hypothetical protein